MEEYIDSDPEEEFKESIGDPRPTAMAPAWETMVKGEGENC